MRASRRLAFPAILSCARGTAAAALLGVAAAAPLAAQAQLQAYYPLLTDLLDVTNNYGPVALTGSPPPSLPNNGVCHNGIYFYNSGGQDIRTPLISSLTTTDMEIDVEFNIAALPGFRAPVIMGGHLWRWLGIYLDSAGLVGIKHNNSNYAWSTTTLTTGRWYAASLKHESGEVQLFIDGALVLQVTTGTLSDGNNLNITTNDYSNGLAFNGCIRNLLIFNDTTIFATASTYGAGCMGSAGVPALAPTNLPQLGTTFTLAASNLAPGSPLAFLSVGLSNTSSALGALPFNLAVLGLGGSCDLWVSADATVLFGVQGGAGSYGFPVPANPALTGASLYFQCASIDSAATGGIAVSNGVQGTMGY